MGIDRATHSWVALIFNQRKNIMPWTVDDVEHHTKSADTLSKKRRWVRTANAILAKCKKMGGTNCEAKAIRIANSLFEK